MRIIAVSGVARAGKDTISDGLASVLRDMNPSLKVMRVSFAEDLKKEMSQFLIENFNINPFEADGKDKELIRPLLVAYGQAKREQTQGRYWVDKVQQKIALENPDVVIISDLRFAQQDTDELFWLKEQKGKLIHVSRYKIEKGKKVFVKPVNDDEKTNDPILKKNSDFQIVWENSTGEADLKEKTKSLCEEFYYKNILFFS